MCTCGLRLDSHPGPRPAPKPPFWTAPGRGWGFLASARVLKLSTGLGWSMTPFYVSQIVMLLTSVKCENILVRTERVPDGCGLLLLPTPSSLFQGPAWVPWASLGGAETSVQWSVELGVWLSAQLHLSGPVRPCACHNSPAPKAAASFSSAGHQEAWPPPLEPGSGGSPQPQWARGGRGVICAASGAF